MVTLALTSLAITFAYSALSYVQQLFYNYKSQNQFINEYTDFKKRMDFESIYSESVMEFEENKFTIRRDSLNIDLQFLQKVVCLKKGERCDTFHFEAKKIRKEYEAMLDPIMANKLLKSLSFEVEFSKQKFNFYFYKNYDAVVKLRLDKQK